MIRLALVSAALGSALVAASSVRAGPVTLADLDPLTRGICEEVAITAACAMPLADVEDEPKGPTPAAARPRPRPDWCATDHAWRFPRCIASTPLEIIVNAYAPSEPFSGFIGPAGPSAWHHSGAGAFGAVVGGSSAWVGARAEARSRTEIVHRVEHVYRQPDGCVLCPPDRPVAPIPLPGAAWMLAGAVAGLGFFRGAKR